MPQSDSKAINTLIRFVITTINVLSSVVGPKPSDRTTEKYYTSFQGTETERVTQLSKAIGAKLRENPDQVLTLQELDFTLFLSALQNELPDTHTIFVQGHGRVTPKTKGGCTFGTAVVYPKKYKWVRVNSVAPAQTHKWVSKDDYVQYMMEQNPPNVGRKIADYLGITSTSADYETMYDTTYKQYKKMSKKDNPLVMVTLFDGKTVFTIGSVHFPCMFDLPGKPKTAEPVIFMFAALCIRALRTESEKWVDHLTKSGHTNLNVVYALGSDTNTQAHAGWREMLATNTCGTYTSDFVPPTEDLSAFAGEFTRVKGVSDPDSLTTNCENIFSKFKGNLDVVLIGGNGTVVDVETAVGDTEELIPNQKWGSDHVPSSVSATLSFEKADEPAIVLETKED